MDVNSSLVNNISVQKPVQAPSAVASHGSATDASAEHVSKPAETDTIKSVQHEANAIAAEKADEKKESVDLDKALTQINKSLASFNRHMEKSFHDKLNRVMVKVVDTDKDKVIREIPPEKLLDAFAKALEMAGVLLDVKQ